MPRAAARRCPGGDQTDLPVHLPRLVAFPAIEHVSVPLRTAEDLADGLQQPVRLYGLAEIVYYTCCMASTAFSTCP